MLLRTAQLFLCFASWRTIKENSPRYSLSTWLQLRNSFCLLLVLISYSQIPSNSNKCWKELRGKSLFLQNWYLESLSPAQSALLIGLHEALETQHFSPEQHMDSVAPQRHTFFLFSCAYLSAPLHSSAQTLTLADVEAAFLFCTDCGLL